MTDVDPDVGSGDGGDGEEGAPLRVALHEEPPGVWVEFAGDIDLFTVEAARKALKRACAEAGAAGTGTSVVMDLRRVHFLDSAGLALLVEARRWVPACPFALLVPPTGQPRRVLALGRFGDFLRIAATPEELAAVPLP